MSEPLPEINVPTGASQFPGFAAWFAALKASIGVQSIEILNRAGTLIDDAVDPLADSLPYVVEGETALKTTIDDAGRVISRVTADGTHEIPQGVETPYAGQSFTESAGYLKVTLDASGRILENALDESGRVPLWVLENWGRRAGGQWGLVSTADLACFGDSMTDDYGAPALPAYPTYLPALMGGVDVYEGGISAQTSTEVALRQGGLKPRVIFPGGTIPASGSTAVTLSITGDFRAGFAWTFGGTVAGVAGILTKASDNSGWTWTRSTAGEAVPIHATGAPFISAEGSIRRERRQVLWAGRNNVNAAVNLRDMRAMVEYLSPARPEYLVVSVCNTTTEPAGSAGYAKVIETNAAYAQAFGPRYVDLRAYVIAHGLADAGITPTADDAAAKAQDRLPPSLLMDSTHFNTPGRQVVAGFIARTLNERSL